MRVSYYLVKKVYRHHFCNVKQGDYVVKLPDNRAFKIVNPSNEKDFDIDTDNPVDMSRIGHTYIKNEECSNPKLVSFYKGET